MLAKVKQILINLCCFAPQMSGIRDLIPGSVIDATMFNPCGYSMNGMKTDVRGAPAIICASISLVIIIDQAKQVSAISLD